MSRAFFVTGMLFCIAGCSLAFGQQTEAQNLPQWVTGSGDSLEIHVTGVAVDESGNPIDNVQVTCSGLSRLGTRPLPVQALEDGRFRISIPCNVSWWSTRITGQSDDGSLVGYKTVIGRELRSIARDGLELTLLKHVDGSGLRNVDIAVVDETGPVPGASVRALVESGNEVRASTDERGIARLPLQTSDKIQQLTAWEGDQRIGGYQLSRQPVRDPGLDRYTVELNPSRPTRVRLVDEQGHPVPGVRFELIVSTGAPNHNYLGKTGHTTLTSDENGEVMVDWFPDRADTSYYVELKTDQWLVPDHRRKTVENNEIAVVLRKSKKDQRQTVQGRVEFPDGSPAGFMVYALSFQGETEHRTDLITAHADSQGNFFLDVLPGATYCYYIDDSERASEMHDAILFDPTTGERASPVLKVMNGEKVQVAVTQGPDKKPSANQSVHLRSVYRFRWIEEGRTRHGSGGRSWHVTTDANGIATTHASAGPLEASIYDPDWRTRETVEVLTDQTTAVRLHRPLTEAIRLKGVLASTDDMNLSEFKVIVAALDGQTQGQSVVPTDESGNFELEVKSTRIGLYTWSNDGRFSATSVVDVPPSEPIELTLQPTLDYSGQLLGENDEPLANVPVRAKVQLDLGWSPEYQVQRRLEGNTIETTTDDEGRYLLTGIPANIRFLLEYQPVDKSSGTKRIGERYATIGEDRPLDVYRTARPASGGLAWAERVSRYLGDCRRYGIHSLVIVSGSDRSYEWAQGLATSYEGNQAILGYLPMVLKTSELDEQQDKQKFLAKYDLQVPEDDHVTLCVLDGTGEALARTDLDCTDSSSMKTAYEFIAENEPPAADAQKKLDAALAEARKTSRVVWVQHSQTRCGPCFALSRWIEEHRDILEKQFVFVKVDNVREENGVEVSRRVTRGRHFGIPFVAIMDPDGEVLVDGEGPLGNIGFPTTFEDAQHLRTIITETGEQISDAELDVLIKSLVSPK